MWLLLFQWHIKKPAKRVRPWRGISCAADTEVEAACLFTVGFCF
uniref:Uncharacterized protein n=1 Tax=Macaca fascicularis TaxID=9541 RepID=I7GNP1_MACFA|nr:unnamed protein product [Macaca fascicularis]